MKDGGTVCGTASASADDVYSKYDLAGRPVWKRFGSVGGEGIGYGYDTAKRLTSETSLGRTLGFEYDLSGNRRRLTYPDNNFIDYEFDGLNRMTYIRENGATSGAGVLAQYRWDALSRRDAASPMTRGNGTTTSYGYDTASRLTSLGHNLGGTVYDATLNFGYTLASQLETRSTTNDALGWWTASAMSKTYVANGLNQYSSVSGVTFSHDLNGNLTGDGSRTFIYDIENRLTSVSGSASMTLSYDPLGRLRQTVSGGATTQFLYDGDRLVAEYNASGTLLRRYMHGPGVDEPIVWYEGPGLTDRRWLHSDERGSVIAHTDSAGSASTYSYGPYGEQSSWSGSRFRYTGQIMLSETQLYYYKARIYDPQLGRFLQFDPVGYDAGPNAYAYVGNDPLNKVDPLGLVELNLFASDDGNFRQIAHALDTGNYDIAAHGNGGVFAYGHPSRGEDGAFLFPDRLYQQMKGYDRGRTVQLWACKIKPWFAAALSSKTKGLVVFTQNYVRFGAERDAEGKITGAAMATSIDYDGNVRKGTFWAAIKELGDGNYLYADSTGRNGTYNINTGKLTEKFLETGSRIARTRETCIDTAKCKK